MLDPRLTMQPTAFVTVAVPFVLVAKECCYAATMVCPFGECHTYTYDKQTGVYVRRQTCNLQRPSAIHCMKLLSGHSAYPC